MAIGCKHVHERVPIEKLQGFVDRQTTEVIQMVLSKDPMGRFPNCMAFLRAIREGVMER
ncbi:MAG: hypothetical protein ACUVTP_05930 [Candidatus Fervidibacter sp.]|uniref:hypothetical protein n=1 Tax=Candidatus Fervidibacter sp. TaxID=3100871 RepID=UPI00404AA193